MIRSYFIFAVRNLLKRKLYSFINIFGLGAGVAVCLTILTYVNFELSYDDFHQNKKHIYRVLTTLFSNGKKIAAVGPNFGPALTNYFPEIKSYVRLERMTNIIVSYDKPTGKRIQFRQSRIYGADSTFLRIFSFKAIQGDILMALNHPSSVVITKDMSDRYFGKEAYAIGKILRFGDRGDYEVTAVLENIPQNSHLSFDFLLPIYNSINSRFYVENPRWDNFITYVELDAQASPATIEAKFPGFIKQYNAGQPKSEHQPVMRFQPITDIHLFGGSDNLDDSDSDQASVKIIYFFIIISIFILLIAWTNYINLSTARAMERAREVGIKKAIGVSKRKLIMQFMFESFMINFAGVIVAIIMTLSLLPVLGTIIEKTLVLNLANPTLWIILIAIVVTGTFASGFYPALVLSSFRSVDVLKGLIHSGRRGFSLRRTLVVFQFAASLLLIAGVFTVYRQVQFMQSRDKGFKTNQMLIVSTPELSAKNQKELESKLSSFKSELLRLHNVNAVTTSGTVPGEGHGWETHVTKKGALESETTPGENMNVIFVDPDFTSTYGLELVAGKSWDIRSTNEMQSILVNEAAVKQFKLGSIENALHEKFKFERDDFVAVQGVLKNFHWKSLQSEIRPTALWPQRICSGSYSIVLTGNIKEGIADVERLYKSTFSGELFEYHFLDDFFNRQYQSELQFGKIFTLFAVFAAMIACLGLLGLSSFTAEQRSKEIGIRKVLGASTERIAALLSSEYLKLLALASLIALPILWIGVKRWLDTFAYRSEFTWDIYLLPVLILTLVTFLTISFQVWKGAVRNPAVTLRTQ